MLVIVLCAISRQLYIVLTEVVRNSPAACRANTAQEDRTRQCLEIVQLGAQHNLIGIRSVCAALISGLTHMS